jgi:hypothetical protein
MKNNNKLALLLSLGALLPFAASAKTLEQSYLESCRKGSRADRRGFTQG